MTGDLLPYALHFGLIFDEHMPLVRFAHAWVRAFADQPGWAVAKPDRVQFDDRIAPATDPGDHMLRQMGTAAFLMGAM